MENRQETVEQSKQLYLTDLKTCFEELAKREALCDFERRRSMAETAFNATKAYLESTDFFTAPASTKYHEAYEGGLCEHSRKVCQHALVLSEVSKFKYSELNIGDIMLAALAHDWCKIGLYVRGTKNVKNDDGKWVKEPVWNHNRDFDLPLGHGETSMVRLLRVFPYASDEVLMAIRWHMGMWDVSGSGQIDFSAACNKHPLVYLIQFADQLSVTEY